MEHGVNRYAQRSQAQPRRGAPAERGPARPRRGDLQRSLAHRADPGQGRRTTPAEDEKQRAEISGKLGLPEENLLYFIEKRAPRLEDWQRELIRIVRHVSQYFYPQKQTQLMNEGCATFVPLRDHEPAARRGPDHRRRDARIPALAFERRVPAGFDDPRYSGINPYALGFAMMRDIKRICAEPTDGGPRVVPRHRRQRRSLRRAAPRLGQLPRRELHPAISEPGGDPRVPPVPDRRRQQQAVAAGRRDPRRARLSPHPQRAVAAIRSVAARARHPGRRCRPDRRPLPGPGALRP